MVDDTRTGSSEVIAPPDLALSAMESVDTRKRGAVDRTARIRLLPVSAIKRLPEPSTATDVGKLNGEAIASVPSAKPVRPLPLPEHAKVRLTVLPESNWVQETYGLIGWKGSAELAERFATDPDLDFPPPLEEP